MIERCVRYHEVAHKDPSKAIVFASEYVYDDTDPRDQLAQMDRYRSNHGVVTAEFMRDAVDALETAGRIILP